MTFLTEREELPSFRGDTAKELSSGVASARGLGEVNVVSSNLFVLPIIRDCLEALSEVALGIVLVLLKDVKVVLGRVVKRFLDGILR